VGPAAWAGRSTVPAEAVEMAGLPGRAGALLLAGEVAQGQVLVLVERTARAQVLPLVGGVA
jgi:hypothetical protein